MGEERLVGLALMQCHRQLHGDPARPGPAGPQVCKASAAEHDPGERLTGMESLSLC